MVQANVPKDNADPHRVAMPRANVRLLRATVLCLPARVGMTTAVITVATVFVVMTSTAFARWKALFINAAKKTFRGRPLFLLAGSFFCSC